MVRVKDVSQLELPSVQGLYDWPGLGGVNNRSYARRCIMQQVSIVVRQAGHLRIRVKRAT